MKFIKRLFRLNRYFTISYNWSSGGKTGMGSFNIINSLGKHPSKDDIDECAKEGISSAGIATDNCSIVILNMIELSARDYKDYNTENNEQDKIEVLKFDVSDQILGESIKQNLNLFDEKNDDLTKIKEDE